MKLPSHIKYFKGKKSGPCLVIIGGLHGNEPVGVMIINELKKILKNTKINGEIYLILGNPQAYKLNKRFIDCDLNRIFHLNFSKPLNIEKKRALEIAPILKKADYLLDIHSTQKPSIPFIYTSSTKKHLKLAKIFETKYIVTGSKKFKAKKSAVSTDNFIDQNGGVGITYESGYMSDLSKFHQTLERTKNFLSTIKVAFFDKKLTKKHQALHLEVQEILNIKSDKFKFQKDYENFSIVKSQEIIAKDGNKCIKKPYNCYIVFPKKDLEIGKVACYLAKKLSYV